MKYANKTNTEKVFKKYFKSKIIEGFPTFFFLNYVVKK